jgi:hypothetical protein
MARFFVHCWHRAHDTIPFMDWIAKPGSNRTGLTLLICRNNSNDLLC